VPESSTIDELNELRRGRGLQAEDLHERVGAQLRQGCSIAAEDRPAVVREKLTLCLAGLCGRLPDDLSVAVLAALALHEQANQRFLHERMAWLAEYFDRDTRTARRRIDEGFRMLADYIDVQSAAGDRRQNEFAPGGWYVELLKVSLRMDVEPQRLMWKKVSEQRQEKGSRVTYECTNDGCTTYLKSGNRNRNREKVFEER